MFKSCYKPPTVLFSKKGMFIPCIMLIHDETPIKRPLASSRGWSLKTVSTVVENLKK